ncbi:MAG: hypothetical protein R3E64_03880 [Halioglobus sp.]
MKKSALACVFFAMASTANAGGADDFSLLRCGVNFGGKTLTYNADAEINTKRDARMNHILGATASAQSSQFKPAMAAEPEPAATVKTETRLPRKFTLATIGCSWR